MAGYSGTPLAKKLGIKAATRLIVVGAPKGFAIPDLPAGVVAKTRISRSAEVVVFFTKDRALLASKVDGLKDAIFPDGAAWIAWPKKASKVATDMTEDVVRELALPVGLVDVKVCAIDDVWSGLKLVVRKELRGGSATSAETRARR